MLTEKPESGLVMAQTSSAGTDDRFRLFVESTKDYAMFVLDPDGSVASWNCGAQQLHGYEASEIIGQHFSRFYPPELVARGWPEYELRMAQSQGRYEDEGWRIRKDGSSFFANVVFTALYDHWTEFRGYAVVIRDLTEHKRVEALEERIRHMEEFLAVLAHELRNPLSPIQNVTGILGSRPSDDQLIWCKSVIERQVGHLSRLIDELFDMARITTGKVILKKTELDLRLIVSQAVEAVSPQVSERRQRLTVDLPEHPVWVHGDATRLLQVVQNLLTNASKFTHEDRGALRLVLRQQDAMAVLQMSDNGIGIAPELLPRIFELFVQGERPSAGAGSRPGLGIGLALIKELVSLHGGTAEAESAGLGRGSRFTVSLPTIEKQKETAVPGRVAPRPHPVVPLRILVVDDNQDVLLSMQLLLETGGHKVRSAGDGASALAAAREFQPHAVLLDLAMPGVTGYEIAQQLRAMPLPHPLLIAMTGLSQPEDRRRSRLAGFDEHLVKPVDINALTRTLARINRTSQSLPIFKIAALGNG